MSEDTDLTDSNTDSDDDHSAPAFSLARASRDLVEFLGRHPFATGLLAILGILGFVISVIGFGLDRSESDRTTRQIDDVETQVGRVVDKLHAECTSPPCWNQVDLMQAQRIGTPKDLIDRKLPPPVRVENGEYRYDLNGCGVTIGYRNDAVSYISASLSRRTRDEDGVSRRISCPVDVPRIMHPSSFGSWTETTYDPGAFPDFPKEPKLVSVKDFLGLGGRDVRLSVACIDCGNAADPFLEAYIPGAPAINNIDFYFRVHSIRSAPQEVDNYRAWSDMEDLYRIGPLEGTNQDLDTRVFCGHNIRRTLGPIEMFYVEEVGIGKGPRGWTGPTVFSCEARR